jgi:hypothetical protein
VTRLKVWALWVLSGLLYQVVRAELGHQFDLDTLMCVVWYSGGALLVHWIVSRTTGAERGSSRERRG